MKKKIVLVGGGGHCKSCIDVIRLTGKYEIVGVLDLPERLGDIVLGHEIVGTDRDYAKYIKEKCEFIITLGQTKSASMRKHIFSELKKLGASFATVVSPLAYVSKSAQIGEGCIVLHGAYVNAGAKIGDDCIINTKSNVEHDCSIGDHCHISTGAFVNGDCIIGNGVFIGSQATISNQIVIKNDAVIGAGSVVVKNVDQNSTVVGVPAKAISR